MSIALPVLLLLVSVVFAWVGGIFFIRGVDGVRKLLRLSGLTAGLLIASISTSSPELFVGINSGLKGTPNVSLGDVLGSNIVNIAFIFGIFLLFSTERISKKDIRLKDVLISCAAPLVILLLSVGDTLSRLDGVILLALFILWFRWLTKENKIEGKEIETGRGGIFQFVLGLGMLVVAGYTFTESAGSLAGMLGINVFFFSAIFVALGTSMPELATSIVAIRTKQNGVAVGNLLGSNVFNSLGILGLVCLIEPISISASMIALPIAFAVVATLFSSLATQFKSRLIGGILILIYFFYIFFTTL